MTRKYSQGRFKELKDKLEYDYDSKGKVIIVNPITNTRGMKISDLKYSDVVYDKREIKKWFKVLEAE